MWEATLYSHCRSHCCRGMLSALLALLLRRATLHTWRLPSLPARCSLLLPIGPVQGAGEHSAGAGQPAANRGRHVHQVRRWWTAAAASCCCRRRRHRLLAQQVSAALLCWCKGCYVHTLPLHLPPDRPPAGPCRCQVHGKCRALPSHTPLPTPPSSPAHSQGEHDAHAAGHQRRRRQDGGQAGQHHPHPQPQGGQA